MGLSNVELTLLNGFIVATNTFWQFSYESTFDKKIDYIAKNGKEVETRRNFLLNFVRRKNYTNSFLNVFKKINHDLIGGSPLESNSSDKDFIRLYLDSLFKKDNYGWLNQESFLKSMSNNYLLITSALSKLYLDSEIKFEERLGFSLKSVISDINMMMKIKNRDVLMKLNADSDLSMNTDSLDLIYLFMYNAAKNSFEHGLASEAEVYVTNKPFTFIFTDNGIGFPEKDDLLIQGVSSEKSSLIKSRGNGMAIMNDIAKYFNSTLSYQGSTLEISPNNERKPRKNSWRKKNDLTDCLII